MEHNLAEPYLPGEPASHHTAERNTLVFTDESQLRPEHLNHPARYRWATNFVSPGDRVLDCASGCGYGAAILAPHAGSVVGVELHQDLVDFARAHWAAPNVEYLCHDVSAAPLPLKDGEFDVVVSLETIEHVPDGEALLAEFRRVLRPGGLLVLSTPQAPLGNPHHVHEYSLGELVQVVEQAGFPVMRTAVHRMAADIRPQAAPVARTVNLLAAGRPAPHHPLAAVVDAQIGLQQALRQELEKAVQAKARFEQALRAEQKTTAHLRDVHERALADHLAYIRQLQADVHNLEGLRIMRLYRRLVTSRPYRALRGLRRLLRG